MARRHSWPKTASIKKLELVLGFNKFILLYGPRRKKICLQAFQLGHTQICLLSHRLASKLKICLVASLDMILSNKQTIKALIRPC